MYRRAAGVFQRLVKLKEYDNMDTWFKQAECYKKIEDYVHAKEIYEKVLKVNANKDMLAKRTRKVLTKSLAYATFATSR